jgi:hypothetical protein
VWVFLFSFLPDRGRGMKSINKVVIIFGFFLASTFLPSCKQKEEPKKGGGGANAVPTASPTVSTGNSTPSDTSDCTQDANSSNSNGEDNFGLTSRSSPNWNDDIKKIFESKCIQCHSGNDELADLTSYSEAKKLTSSIKSEINSATMPPTDETPLSSSEKEKILKWVTGGALQSSSSSNSSSSNSSNNDCGDSNGGDGGDDNNSDDNSDDGSDDNSSVSGWDEFLNPTKLKECKDSGKIYDRSLDKCHRAKIATAYECTRSGIVSKFKSLGINIASQMDTMDTDGYEIDQCGEYKNEPVVLFYKKEDSNTEELKLKIRKLCKKGSEACSAD